MGNAKLQTFAYDVKPQIQILCISMQLADQHLDEFIALYQNRYGETLDRDKALEKGLHLCRLVELVSLDSKNENAYGK